MDTPVIELKNVWKTYQMGNNEINALRDVSLKINKGEFVAVVGPSGSGKCVSGDTEVILEDGIPIKIEQLKNKKNFKVLSLCKGNGKILPFKVTNFHERYVNEVYKIKTTSGRMIEVTREHPFFTIGENGFSQVNASTLKKGMFVGITRKIDIKGHSQKLDSLEKLSGDKSLIVFNSINLVKNLKKSLYRHYICRKFGFNKGTYDCWGHRNNISLNNFKKLIEETGKKLEGYDGVLELTALSSKINVKIPEKTTPELLELYGFLVGDGNIDHSGIRLTSTKREIIVRFKKLIKDVFGLECRVPIKGRVDCNTSVLRIFFYRVFEMPPIKKAWNIELPDFLFKCNTLEIASFIRGLFDCDSYVSKDKKEISIILASETLIHQLSVLLLRFGIVSRLNKRVKYASNTINKTKRVYFNLVISGHSNLNLFKKFIAFNSMNKLNRLNKHLYGKAGTNVDVIPCGKLLRHIRRSSKISLPRRVHKLLWAYEREIRRPTLKSLKKIISILKKFRINVTLLEDLIKKELFWDKILSIEKINKKVVVYDLTVPEADNFVANGFVIHNSTMMNIIGCLDLPTKGTIFLNGKDITKLSESTLANLRGKAIGFIFQQFNLIPTLTALENVTLPMMFQNINQNLRLKVGTDLLTKFGLNERLNHKPNELSGGQSQRVAISRALANNPDVILADEPTGNLDSKTGEEVMNFLTNIHEREGKTVVLVTHDLDLVHHAERVIYLKDGSIDKITKV